MSTGRRGGILALDYGTTALKAVLYDCELNPLAKAQREWTYLYPRAGHIEMDAELYWEKTVQAIREVLPAAQGQPIAAVSVTGQSETLICLDANGAPIGNAIVWLDTRPQQECADFTRDISGADLYRKTGNTGFDPVMPILKLSWMQKHEPERYAATRVFLLLKEYIIYRLSGQIIGEYSAQSCSGWFDINTCDYDDELLAYAKIDRAKLPPLKDSQYIAGSLSEAARLDTGITGDALVVNGLLDQCASGIGAGAVHSGTITETTGTVLAIGAVLDHFDGDTPDMLVLRHGLKGKFQALPNCSTAGVLLKRFRDEFLPEGASYDDINRAIIQRGREESGLLLLPHFAGYLSPVNNAQARGVIYGLSLDTTKWDVAHAIMEGVGFLLKENLDLLHRHGLQAERIISLGGGAKSPLWLSIKANICGCEMCILQDDESTALGCALNACMALGWITEEDVPRYVRAVGSYAPTEAGMDVYRRKYQNYLELNTRLGFNPPCQVTAVL